MNLDGPIRADGASALRLGHVKGLVMGPSAEWDRIAAERTSCRALFFGWVAPLAAIGPVALVCDGLWFGGARRAASLSPGLIGGALGLYAVNLIMTCVVAHIIDALAPRFGGRRDRVAAFKLAAYAGAAGWIAGVCLLSPWLIPLAALGAAYSLVLLYRGLPRLMRSPCDSSMSYCGLTVGVALALGALVFVTVGSVAAALQGGPIEGWGVARPSSPAALLQAAQAAQQAVKQAGTVLGRPMGAPKALSPDALGALMPARVDDLNRRSLSGERRTAARVTATRATARYDGPGTQRLSLSLSDLAAAGALTGMVSGLDVERSRETPDGYVRVERADGRLAVEAYDRRSSRGRYAVLVADRFLVEADGQGLPMADLKSAVGSLDYDRLDALARGDDAAPAQPAQGG